MQFMRTRLHYSMHVTPGIHPSPAAVHYYGGHKKSMHQLDALPHWFLIEDSLFGYAQQGDGCLRVVPPTSSLHNPSTTTEPGTSLSSSSSPTPAPPGLDPPTAVLTPRPSVHPALLTAPQAAAATLQRENHSSLYKGVAFVNPGTEISVQVFGPCLPISEPPPSSGLYCQHPPSPHFFDGYQRR